MTKMQKAGLKAWKTRRENILKRHDAAIKAWVVRKERYGVTGKVKG